MPDIISSAPASSASPAIATMEPMEMSAPMQQMPADIMVASPRELINPSVQLPQNPIPLHENVAPFSSVQQESSGVEYVLPKTESPVAQPEPSIVRTAAAAPAIPASAVQLAQPMLAVNKPATMPALEPAPRQPLAPVAAAQAPPVASLPPQSPPQYTVASRTPNATAYSASKVATEQEVQPVATVLEPAAATVKSGRIYSNNTREVWQARRVNKVLYIVATTSVVAIAGVLYIFWLSLGAPTDVESIPYVKDMSS